MLGIGVRLFVLLLFVPLILYVLSRAIYNAYFHPLAKFPGPKLWSTSFLFRHFAAMSGNFDWKLKSFHETYGEVVRYSPEELSFTSEQAWRDIYAHKPTPLIKDPMIYNAVKLGPDGALSIFNADDVQHARIRKQLSHAFSEKALRDQEPTLKSYVNLLLQKLRGVASSDQPTDMVRWLNYTTFDLIGDLAIGTSFGCLRDSQYHSWVRSLQEGTKIGPYIRTIATYTNVERLWRLFAPKSIKAARKRHEEYVRLNAEERLSRGVLAERKDFLSYILGNSSDKDALTDMEVAANAGFLIIAGSEAAATAMSGILFHLLRNSNAFRFVTKEIRESFKDEAEIDFMTTAARLPYLMACINEGMRAYPPGPTIPPRRTPQGQYTTIAGYDIPSWTSVGVHPLSTTHSTANFHLPDEFIPERWLPSSVNDTSSPFYNDKREAVQPFGVGSRACLGKGLAYNEMRVILARLIWNFDIVLCDEAKDWDKQKSYTLWEKRQLLCTLRDIRSTEQN